MNDIRNKLRIAMRWEALLAAGAIIGILLNLDLTIRSPSATTIEIARNSSSFDSEPEDSFPLMFVGVANHTNLTDAVDLTINIEALEQGRTVWLPVGPNGQLVEFSNYETTKDRNSTSFIGALTLGGVELPTTITTSERSIFATIPTAEGVIEGRGSPDNIAFQKRPAFRDLMDLNLFEEESTEVHRASEGTCLNC